LVLAHLLAVGRDDQRPRAPDGPGDEVQLGRRPGPTSFAAHITLDGQALRSLTDEASPPVGRASGGS
jgi:hypothetical protein